MTAVISDNWDKGSVLAEKLEGESNLLWISRKKRAEEKGKLAETKLTFPLVILLIVLIMVTIAPALMEL
jgi:tight adherence protein C